MRIFMLTLFVTLALVGSAIAWTWGTEKELDFTSVETMQKTVEEATKNMTPADKKAFGQALLAILMEKNPITGATEPGLPRLMAMGQLGNKFFDGMIVWMSGVTVAEVKAKATAIAAHEIIKKDMEERVAIEKKEMAKLLVLQQNCLNKKLIISNINIVTDRFTNNIKFDITNNLDFAISGVHFEYTVKQEGRSVPIRKDSSSFSISGGVEPGETKSLSYYYYSPMGEAGKIFIETRMINAFDALDLPLLDTNTMYLDRPKGISDQKCE